MSSPEHGNQEHGSAVRVCHNRSRQTGAWHGSVGMAQHFAWHFVQAGRASRKGSSRKVQEPPTEATNRLNTWKGKAGFYINACSMKDNQEEPKNLIQSQRFGICGITETCSGESCDWSAPLWLQVFQGR